MVLGERAERRRRGESAATAQSWTWTWDTDCSPCVTCLANDGGADAKAHVVIWPPPEVDLMHPFHFAFYTIGGTKRLCNIAARSHATPASEGCASLYYSGRCGTSESFTSLSRLLQAHMHFQVPMGMSPQELPPDTRPLFPTLLSQNTSFATVR